MKHRLRLAALVLVSVLFVMLEVRPALAGLGDMDFWVVGGQGSPASENSTHRYWGVSSSVYCSEVLPVWWTKVSSVYSRYDSNDYYETGISWDDGWTAPKRWFAWMRDGMQQQQKHWVDGATVEGQTYYHEINNYLMDNSPPVTWRANSGGENYDQYMNFYKGNSLLSSERLDVYNTPLYARYNQMKFRDYNGTWVNWSANPTMERSEDESTYKATSRQVVYEALCSHLELLTQPAMSAGATS